MARPWDADEHLEPERAERLVETQFPTFAPARLDDFGTGWDNDAYLVNGTAVFRFPRRTIAVPWIQNEALWLPRLAPLLPLPIPRPEWIGAPAEGYPYPFAGYRLLAGTTACRAPLTEPDRLAAAAPLGRFLRALHSVQLDAPETPPHDEIRRADPVLRRKLIEDRLPRIEHLEGLDVAAIRALCERLEPAPLETAPLCWVHGDLYARHLLIDDANALCGVIDWGDVHVGDRAVDLAIAFSFLPRAARADFLAAYGDVDAATWDRARMRGLFYGVVLLDYGIAIEDAALQSAAWYALDVSMR
jgi:aminoglycoside phosphotransferase (APT) family kinase protein